MSKRTDRTLGTITCTGCGRRLAITWPTRSLICGCGTQVLPPPRPAPPGMIRRSA